ncbi:MAG: sugar ABC transporter substrate-binding protein [Solirubrobacteraceae bacterium]
MCSIIRDALCAARAAMRTVALRATAGVGILVVSVALAACGSTSSSSSASAGASSSGSANGAAASAARPLAGKTVAIVSVANSNPWAAVYNAAIKSYVGSRGATVHLLASSDPATQVQLLNSAVAEHPSLIFLEALDSKAMAPAIAKAKAAGVTIVNTDGPADPAVASGLHQVLSDNYQLGQFAAENLIQGLAQEHKTAAKIGVITGTAAMLVTQDRMKGFYNVLDKHPRYKVVATEDGNWDPVLSGQEATQLFSKFGHSGLQAMYGMADYQAVPIVTAAKQAGIPLGTKQDGLVITGSNCFKVGINAIKAGEMFGTATEDPGTISLQAAEYGTALLEGKKVPLVETVQEHQVTPSTLAQYEAQCSKA